MVFTRLAVLLATSLADWTNWRLATGLAVRDDARRHVLHRAEVCFATMVAADSTCRRKQSKARCTMTHYSYSSPFSSTLCSDHRHPFWDPRRLTKILHAHTAPIWTVTIAPKLPAGSQCS